MRNTWIRLDVLGSKKVTIEDAWGAPVQTPLPRWGILPSLQGGLAADSSQLYPLLENCL